MIKQIITMVTLTLASIACLGGVEYETRWKSSFNMEISKALADISARDCGEYKYKAATNNSGEYYVRCSSFDYLVFKHTGKALGPYKKDPSMD